MQAMSWELAFGAGAALLGAIILYAMWRNSTRDRRLDRATEEAARRNFDADDPA